MTIDEFLTKVHKHLGSDSVKFLKLQFSKNTMDNFNKNLHRFIVNKIDGASLKTKFDYMFKPGRFSDDYISKISGLSKDIIDTLRKNPKESFIPSLLNDICIGINRFYEYHMAIYYGLTYWDPFTTVKQLRADTPNV